MVKTLTLRSKVFKVYLRNPKWLPYLRKISMSCRKELEGWTHAKWRSLCFHFEIRPFSLDKSNKLTSKIVFNCIYVIGMQQINIFILCFSRQLIILCFQPSDHLQTTLKYNEQCFVVLLLILRIIVYHNSLGRQIQILNNFPVDLLLQSLDFQSIMHQLGT